MNRNVVLRSLLVLVVVALTVLTVPLQTVAVDPGIQNFRLPFDGGPFGISQGPRCVCEDPNICSHNSGQGARNTEAIDFSS